MNNFIQKLVKVELHAHLSGCMRQSTFMSLFHMQNGFYPQFAMKPTLDEGFKIFAQIHQLQLNHDTLRRVVREVLEDFCADNVCYLELRSTPRPGPDYTEQEYVEIVLDEMDRFQQSNDMICRFIVSIDRAKGVENAYRTLQLMNRPGIVGVDFSGYPSSQYYSDYEEVFKEIKALGYKITAHLGEVDSPTSIQETKQMIALGVDRIGHLCFYDEECLFEVNIKKRNIPIEICFTSNMCTLQLEDGGSHHIQHLRENGIITIPCTDDTLCFRTSLSNEISLIQVR